MKKILLLIFGALIALPAICQTQFLADSIGITHAALMKVKLREVVDSVYRSDGYYSYMVESNVEGSSTPKTLVRVLTIQIPLSIKTTEAQRKQIAECVKNILEPVVIPKPDIESYIDDQATTGNVYSTGWTSLKNQSWQRNHIGNTSSFTTNTGTSSVTIKFDGYRFEWISEKRVNHGIASIKIDNLPAIEVDLYDPRTDNPSLVVYQSPDLGSGAHTVIISMTGRKNPAATEANIIHDAIKTYKKQ